MKTFSKVKQVARPQHSRNTRQNKDYLKTSKQSSKNKKVYLLRKLIF